MPELRSIPADEAAQILRFEEGHYLDVKRVETRPAKLSETISAFANTSGGEVFLGVAEDKNGNTKTRRWAGFPDMEAANAHIQVLEGMGALGNHYRAIGRDLTGIRSENSMKEVFYRLNKRLLIERVPGKRGNASAWRPYTGANDAGNDDEDDFTRGDTGLEAGG